MSQSVLALSLALWPDNV